MGTQIDPDQLGKVVGLYVQTKSLIIKAEESDPQVSSNIAIIREQRDALDHLMRVLGDFAAEKPRGQSYRQDNLDKAVGHLYRAAYDALDSLAISLKMRISKALEGCNNEALTAVFPEYYAKYLEQIDAINDCVAQSRSTKDVGLITEQHMREYQSAVEQLAVITRETEKKAPALGEFRQRQKRQGNTALWNKVLIGLLLSLLGILIGRLTTSGW